MPEIKDGLTAAQQILLIDVARSIDNAKVKAGALRDTIEPSFTTALLELVERELGFLHLIVDLAGETPIRNGQPAPVEPRRSLASPGHAGLVGLTVDDLPRLNGTEVSR